MVAFQSLIFSYPDILTFKHLNLYCQSFFVVNLTIIELNLIVSLHKLSSREHAFCPLILSVRYYSYRIP